MQNLLWTREVTCAALFCAEMREAVLRAHVPRQNNKAIRWHLLAHFYSSLTDNGLKSSENYSASVWCNKFPICLLENPQTRISMISGFLDVSPSPQNQYYVSLETPRDLNESNKYPESF